MAPEVWKLPPHSDNIVPEVLHILPWPRIWTLKPMDMEVAAREKVANLVVLGVNLHIHPMLKRL